MSMVANWKQGNETFKTSLMIGIKITKIYKNYIKSADKYIYICYYF